MSKFILLLITGLLLFSSVVYAHNPSELRLFYDSKTKILTVVIKHEVIDPKTHYIRKVVVKRNGKPIFTHNMKEQTDKYTQTFEYPLLNVKFLDEISVTAYCNQAGQKTETIVITQ